MAKEMTIPERLGWLLEKRGVSQNALARAAKVSPQTIANTLHHGRVPQARTTQRWAKALGVPTSFFAARPMSELALLAVVEKAGAFQFSDRAGAPSTKRTTTKAGTVKTSTTKKAVTKSATAKSAGAKKTAAKKTVAKKPVAKKPVAKKAVAKKTVTAKKATSTTMKKGAAMKSTAKKPISKAKVTKPAKKAMASKNGAGLGIDRDMLMKKLVKLTSSKQDAVALDATKTLLTLMK